MKLTEVNCYACGSKEYKYYDSENGFNLVKCSGCGLLFVNPRPSQEEISETLATGVHPGETTINFTGIYEGHKIKKYLNILSDFFPAAKEELNNKKWLDVGCGYGELLESLKIYTKDKAIVKDTDPNEAKIQYVRSKNLDAGYIDLNTHKEKYDVISLLNVYSHIPDPVEFISGLKKNLNPKGEIFLQTGHSCHLPVRYHHKPYQMPDHLSFANQEIVENIFKKLGFETVLVKIYKLEFFPYTFNLIRFMREIARVLVRRRKSFRGLMPRYPYQDMFMRFRLAS